MKKLAYGVAIAGAIVPSLAHAQLKIDMTQWTCAQYLAMSPDDAANFAAWMSGWYNQKQGYVWVNLQAYERAHERFVSVLLFLAVGGDNLGVVVDAIQKNAR
jgi:hypothetical protein